MQVNKSKSKTMIKIKITMNKLKWIKNAGKLEDQFFTTYLFWQNTTLTF